MPPDCTTGPWQRNIKPATKYPVIFSGRNTHVAQVCISGIPPEEVEANICLIAAAPETAKERDRLKELLAKCKDIVYCAANTEAKINQQYGFADRTKYNLYLEIVKELGE